MDGHVEETSPPRGRKRHADDNLDGEQRLSKRFNLLNLEHNGKLYIPVQSNAPASASSQNDSMQLDDTKDKVYIHNLAAELADIESDEETPLFLPDIEKKLSKTPARLSVPQEQDNVRRAIIDSRARSIEKQAQEHKAAQANGVWNARVGNNVAHTEETNGFASIEDMDVDDNAMDIG